MKKFLALICVIAIFTTFMASCGNETTENPSESGQESTTASVSSRITPGIQYEEIGDPSVKTTPTFTPSDIRVISLKIDTNTLLVEIGKKATITATVKPDNAKDPSIYWESSNDNVKIDKDGNVLGMNAGGATITAVTNDNGYEKTCKVIVYQNKGNDEKSAELITLLNKARTENPVKDPEKDKPLEALATDNQVLIACANQRAYEEGLDGEMDNTRPDGTPQDTILKDYDFWTSRFTCLSSVWGNHTAQQVADIILKDEKNKEILCSANGTYDYISVGYYEANNVTYWTVYLAAV